MNKAKLSIITINYNNCSGLKKTIKSVISQDYNNIEYIIIDGGSTDCSIEVIKKHEKYIHYWISEKDEGISDAFNKGLKHITGDYVGIINSGDYYKVRVFNMVFDFVNLHGPDMICGNLGLVNDSKVLRIKKSNVRKIKQYMSVCHPTVFFKSSIYHDLGGFSNDYKVAMDYDFVLKAVSNGYDIRYFDSHIANMELDGVSRTNEFKGLYESFRIKNKYLGGKVNNLIELLLLGAKAILKRIMVLIKLYGEA